MRGRYFGLHIFKPISKVDVIDAGEGEARLEDVVDNVALRPVWSGSFMGWARYGVVVKFQCHSKASINYSREEVLTITVRVSAKVTYKA